MLKKRKQSADPLIRAAAKRQQRIRYRAKHPIDVADHDAIAKIYECARFLDVDVDHIVPLRSPRVCGLHVEHNLRTMLPGHNAAKGNRHWPGMAI